MTKPAASAPAPVNAFPRPEGTDLPARVFEQDEIITGEAVALKVQPAGPVPLIAAGAIDLFITITLLFTFLLLLLILEPVSLTAMTVSTYMTMATVIAVVLLPAVIETVSKGRSVGKWILGIQIVRDDGGTIRFRHAISRALAGILEILATFGSVAVIATISNPRHKRLGDLLAGTYPISVNSGELLPPPLIMPPELEEWAHRVDLTRLTGTLAWRVRQFLNTTAELAPEHRAAGGQSLASEVQEFVSIPPPPHTHPERFLAAVLVLRRDSEFLTNSRTEAALHARLPDRLPFDLDSDATNEAQSAPRRVSHSKI